MRKLKTPLNNKAGQTNIFDLLEPALKYFAVCKKQIIIDEKGGVDDKD